MEEAFESECVDIPLFLSKFGNVPCEELMGQLESLNKRVQLDLFNLINNDLVKFQDLLKDVVCNTDLEGIKTFRSALEPIKKESENSFLKFKSYYKEVEIRSQRLEYVERKRNLVMGLMRTRSYIDRFKNVTFRTNEDFNPSIYELEVHVLNYLWIMKFITSTPDLNVEGEDVDNGSIYQEISQFSEELQIALQTNLSTLFQQAQCDCDSIDTASTPTRTINNINSSNTMNLIKMVSSLCVKMKKLTIFESAFTGGIIEPKMNFIITNCNCTVSNNEKFHFKAFLKDIFKFLLELKANWSDLITLLYTSEFEYKFWVQAVLGPIVMFVCDRCTNVFVPTANKLDEFKENFEEGLNFIKKIEAEFFTYEDEIVYFRNTSSTHCTNMNTSSTNTTHGPWISFMKKWPLHEYFKIRTKGLTESIEKVLLDVNVTKYSASTELHIQMDSFSEATLIIINSLNQIWISTSAQKHNNNNNFVLIPLIPKFIKFTLQILKRFLNYSTTIDPNANAQVFLVSQIRKYVDLKYFISNYLTSVEEEEEVEVETNDIKFNFIKEIKKYILLEGIEVEEEVVADADYFDHLIDNFKAECENSLFIPFPQLIKERLLQIYDKMLLKANREEKLNLKSVLLLKDLDERYNLRILNCGSSCSKEEVNTTVSGGSNTNMNGSIDLKELLIQILLKVNRTIFKSIDESSPIKVTPSEIKEIEEDVRELGCSELIEEEFWIEIKKVIIL